MLERSLGGGKHLTRTALGQALTRAGIAVDGLRLAFLMMDAELDQVICSGPRQGKQFTYALLDERAPRARVLKADEALAELTRRYFTSHGPATVRDFVWWSGLTVKQTKAGLEMLGRAAASESCDGVTYWSMPSATPAKKARGRLQAGDLPAAQLRRAHERPQRSRALSRIRRARRRAGAFVGFPHQLADRRHPARRLAPRRRARQDADPRHAVQAVSKSEKQALAAAVEQYATFMNLPTVLSIV